MCALGALTPIEKLTTGIEGFDHITLGGLPSGRTTLIAGSSGSGKTIVGLELLYRNVLDGGGGVFVTMEERSEDIVRNVLRFGWNIAEMVEDGRITIVDASPEAVPHEEIGSYDLEGLLTQVRYAIERSGASLVVIDSIGALFQQLTNHGVIRREIFRIADALRRSGVTSVLTVERLEEYGQVSRFGVEEFVSDNVIILRNVLLEEKVRRTIQVLKMRGDTHFKGEYPFTMTATGVSVLPLSARELGQSSSNVRLAFGAEAIDRMAGGGLFRDSITLVSGPTGSGKTLLSCTFAAEGCRSGERVLMLAYEESPDQLMRNADSWGLEFRAWEKEGRLKVLCQYPEAMGLEDHLLMIQREIDRFQPKRMVIDSVSAIERVGPIRYFREFVLGLTAYAKQQEVCALFTATTPRITGGDSITEAHISSITDAIILLRYVEIGACVRRGICIMKMRGSQHEKQIREFTIDEDGIHIGEPFENVQNIVLGMPSMLPPSEAEHLADMFD